MKNAARNSMNKELGDKVQVKYAIKVVELYNFQDKQSVMGNVIKLKAFEDKIYINILQNMKKKQSNNRRLREREGK